MKRVFGTNEKSYNTFYIDSGIDILITGIYYAFEFCIEKFKIIS